MMLLAVCCNNMDALLRVLVVLVAVTQASCNERIVGGEEAVPHSSPHIVHLDNASSFYCGGSLVNNLWIISAAHCYFDPIYFNVVLGDHNTGYPEGTEQVIKPSKAFSHPQYNTATKDYDVMLIKLSESPELNQFVQPIQLPSKFYETTPGTECSVCGWGNTASPGYHYPAELRCATLPVISRAECDNYYSGRISDTMICLGKQQGGIDACDGDSGGPVVCDGVLAGVVSWGYGCAYSNFPGVNAKVSSAMDWIQTTIAYN